MWERFDPRQVDRDFARARQLGARTIRVIVQPEAFGYPVPSRRMMARLDEVIGLAAAHGLRTWLTLFDWWSRYSEIGPSTAWATALLSPYRGDPRMAAVELQNELDPSDSRATDWARALVPALRRIAPGIPVVMSVSDQAGPPGLARLKAALGDQQPDIYSYHLYLGGHGEQAAAVLGAARAAASPTPLVVGETGYPTGGSASVADRAFHEAQQRLFFEQVTAGAAANGLASPAPWMLADLKPQAVPSAVRQSTRATERSFGLLRLDGSAKPVAAVVRGAFGHGPPQTWFNQRFSACAPDASGRLEPLAWREDNAGGALLRCQRRYVRGGPAAVSLSQTAGTAAAVPAFTIDPPLVIAAGRPLSASAWALSRGATGENRIAVAFFASDGRYLGQVESRDLQNADAGWRRLTVSTRVPPGAAWFELALKSAHNRGTVVYGDAEVSVG